MRLAIVTAGAVGAFFGARFARQGTEVRFVARGRHLEALQQAGLKLRGRPGDLDLPPGAYFVTDDSAEAVRGAELVLFAVKSFDTAALAQALRPGLGDSTPVLSLQNGVENEETLKDALGVERVAGGVAYIFAQLTAPGTVAINTPGGRLVLADKTLAGQPLPHLAEFLSLCAAAGVPCETTPDIAKVKWTKLVFNSALNGWTTLRRERLDLLLADPESRQLFEDTVRETIAVARAAGVALDPDIFDRTMATAVSMGQVGSSMLGDFEQGRPLELEALNGAVVRKGRALGIHTPLNEQIYETLLSLSQKPGS